MIGWYMCMRSVDFGTVGYGGHCVLHTNDVVIVCQLGCASMWGLHCGVDVSRVRERV